MSNLIHKLFYTLKPNIFMYFPPYTNKIPVYHDNHYSGFMVACYKHQLSASSLLLKIMADLR